MIKKSLNGLTAKLGITIAIILVLSFSIASYFVRDAIRNEVLDQWRDHNLKLVNVYSQMFDENNIQDFVNKIDSENDLAYVLFIDTDLIATAHSNVDRIGIELDDPGSIAAAQNGEEYADFFHYSVTDSLTLDILTPIYSNNELIGAINIGVNVDTTTLNNVLRDNLLKLALIFVLIAIISTGVLITFVRYLLTKPIANLSKIIDKLSKYDLTFDENDEAVKYLKRKDEIGTITKALATMQKNLIELIKDIQGNSQHVASSSEELTATSEESATAADEVAKTIEEIARGASDQAKETEQGVANISELGKLIEKEQGYVNDLNNSTKEVNKLKDEGFEVLRDLIEKTNISNESAKEIHGTIITTNESAEKIEAASQMIKNIAEQTNLLALNAAIEAARAGDAGKGFAVVAEEIRKLAEQSNSFTEEITLIIKELTDKTEHAVNTMQEVGKVVASQTESVELTNAKFQGIDGAIERMKEVILSINESGQVMETKKDEIIGIIENLSAISEENAASTEEASASVEEQTTSMEEISNASKSLSRLAEEMQENVGKFKY